MKTRVSLKTKRITNNKYTEGLVKPAEDAGEKTNMEKAENLLIKSWVIKY